MRRAAGILFRVLLVAILALAAAIVWDRYYAPPADLPALVPPDRQIDRILVEKGARRLTVFRDGAALQSYPVALGFAPVGDKAREGDGRTPEGVFRVDRRNPDSAYHLSLGIDYPQPDDLARAREGGYSPGGDIFIHGQPNGLGRFATLPHDWTAGCIAVPDRVIEALWAVTPVGTVVDIRP